MLSTQGYAAMTAKAALQPFLFERREVGPQDVLMMITHCGICHSDIHQVRDEWGGSIFPMVPGHEIVGTVTQIGSAVKTFKVGERAGVGCFVDSCHTCGPCREGSEQYCEAGMLLTYNSRDKDGQPTQGGYSTQIVVNEQYVLRIPPSLSSAGAAPLVVRGHHGLLSAAPLGRRQVSQACSGGIGWTGPYGCEDRQGARNRSNCLEHL